MLERWNPTVKAFAVLICVILLSFEYLVSLNLLVLAVCLLLLMFCSRVSLKKIGVILLPACIAAFGLFVTGLYYARGGSTQTMDLSSLSAMPYSVRAAMSQNLYTALQLATRLLAYAGLGILFALSTEGDFFIASLLHQCHLPPKFAYGILAAFHLMPGMAREYAQVRTALAARGLRQLPGVEVFTGPGQSGVLSFRCRDLDCEEAAACLAEAGIAVRAGLHCAPMAHRSGGTLETGTVRVSFSAFNTSAEVRQFLQVCRTAFLPG